MVWAIWRCSSVKSSGKKQSAGVGLAMRKLPPGMWRCGSCFVAFIYDFHSAYLLTTLFYANS